MRENKEQNNIIYTVPKLIWYSLWSSARVNIRSSSFNINVGDMFFEKYECEIACNTDDNTPHTYDSDFYTVLMILTWKTLCFTEKIH